MTNGAQSKSFRSRRICSQWLASSRCGRHIRGLEEKIWNVLAPTSRARSAARKTPPAVER
jgi:hypothetical protein